jgi:beta-lactamase superfamily II metal-dependent hydrolase
LEGVAILIRSPEKTALVDAGPSRHVVELLKARGIKSLDLLVVSHHHHDHFGGMAAVIREFRPRVFLASGSSHPPRPI